VHGKHDSGLAAELYGRIAILKFERVDDAAQRDALKLVSAMRANIEENARPPWLLPRFECCGSHGREGSRCICGFPAGEGPVYGLAFVRRGGVNVLLSGGRDGTLRLEDMCASGRQLHVMSGHDRSQTGVCVANKCSVGAAVSTVIVSCSRDGSVRIWVVDDARHGDELCMRFAVQQERALWCVAIAPDAQPVIPGGIGLGDRGAAPDDAAPERGEYRVHVWMRRGAAACSSASAGTVTTRPWRWPAIARRNGARVELPAARCGGCGGRCLAARGGFARCHDGP
jgi:WD domain, G-beta repeat